MSLNECIIETLSEVSTATLSTILLTRGIRNVWIRGALPIPGTRGRVVGPAFTLRFIPAREDLSTPESWACSISTRGAIEEMPHGCVAVADAMGVTDAGIVGDILCTRMKRRGVAALVTDGVIRDMAGIVQTRLPVWCNGVSARPSIAGLTFANWQEPIACGGVAVYPGDIVVVDDDGAVIIPTAYLDDVVSAAAEQEDLEIWIMEEVRNGAALPGLYPLNEENAAKYARARNGNRGRRST